MNSTDSQLDLGQLAVPRSSKLQPSSPPRSRRLIARYLVPLFILAGFLVLLASAARRQLIARPGVTVIPVVVQRGTVQRSGTPLFQAAGWIEPRPTAVRVAALVAGVVDELLVVEGQNVEKDEPVARLIDVDAKLAVDQAEAAIGIREAELQLAEAEHAAAVLRLDRPVHLNALLAEAKSQLARVQTEFKKLPFLIDSAQASLQFADSNYEGKKSAQGAIAGIIVDEAKRDLAAARAKLRELQQREPNLRQEIDSLQDKVDALQEQRSLLVEERRQEAEAKAKVAAAQGLLDEAKLNLQRSRLNLQRTVVRAPMAGRVLRLVASPGTRVSGLNSDGDQSSGTVVEMYDPRRLQVRADVRLEDVPLVQAGGPVSVETASAERPIQGRVLQSTSSANVQKNTLEVKVELMDPPAAVSPEMLVTATFLAPELLADDQVQETERILVPAQLIQRDESRSWIWTVDAEQRAVQTDVRTGPTEAGRLIEVIDGLDPTDKLITSGTEQLTPGQQVEVVGEDKTIGREQR